MNKDGQDKWGHRLDRFCLWTGTLLPIGIVLGNTGFEACVNLTWLFWLTRCILIRNNPFHKILKHPFTIPWLAWFGVILVSLIWNGPGSKGLIHDVGFLRFILFGFALIDISQRLPVGRYFVYGLMAGIGYAALNTAMVYLVGFDLVGNPISRYTEKVREAERIAVLSTYSIPFFFLLALEGKEIVFRNRMSFAVTFVIACVLLLQTRIRTAFIGMVVGILFSLGYLAWKRLSMRIILPSLIGIAIIFILCFQIFDFGSLSSIYDRVYYWRVSLALWLENPIIGVSVSSFRDAYHQMAVSGSVEPFIAPDGSINKLDYIQHSHNIFIMLLASTGILGLGTFIWLFINAIRLIIKNHEGLRLGLLTWPIVLFTIGLTGWNIYNSWYQSLLAFFLVLIGSVNFKDLTASD